MAAKKTIVQKHLHNFESVKTAFKHNVAGLVECQLKATGEKVAVICAITQSDTGEYDITPFAMFFNGNPYDILNPPNPDGGFTKE